MNALTAEWVDKAEHDFQAAQRLMRQTNDEPALPDVSCFHCQQCAEKYLKAFLHEHNVRFAYTHPLIEHLELCGDVDAEFSTLDADLRELDGYSVRGRYPGIDVTLDMGQEALAATGRVRKFVREKLGL